MAFVKYDLKVSGEGKRRHRGVLAEVLPRALDLLLKSTYTLTISEAVLTNESSPGVLRLRHLGYRNIEAHYEPNPNHPSQSVPGWIDEVPNLLSTLGAHCQWRTPTPS